MMKHKFLPIFVIAVLVINGCLQRATPTLDFPTNTLLPTQTPRQTLNDAIETAVLETSTVSPTKILEQDSNFTFQCLDIQPSIPDNFETMGNIVLKDYYGERALYAIQLPTDNSNARIFSEEFIFYPAISPNGKLLASIDSSEEGVYRLVLVNLYDEIQKTMSWQDAWGILIGWLNDNHLALSYLTYDRDQMIILNPFTGDMKNIAFEQFPDFNFILNFPWANYDPTLSRVIYPTGGGSVLFDTENQKVLAEIPNGDQLQSTDVSWKMDGSSATVIGSIFPLTKRASEELFIVTRDGIVEQLTNLANYYENVVLSSPGWSPDGKHIAFWETDSLNEYQDRKLLIIDVDTKQVTNYCLSTYHDLYGNFGEVLPAPIWSPDGTQILVENRYSEDHNRVVLIDITKAIAVQIAQDSRPIGWMTTP